MTSRTVAVITGASRGIGLEFARVFAAHGHDVALVARSERDLDALASDLAEAAPARPRPIVVALDLAAAGSAERLAEVLAQAGANVQFLVNNAGFGLAGDALDLDRAEQAQMIDLNVRSLVDLTLKFADEIAAMQGGILNVASTAAFQPGPGMAVYYASKSFVLSFSEALSRELHDRGVAVTALCPGPTATEFQARAGFDAAMLLRRLPLASARDVAEAGYAGLMSGRRVVVPGFFNKLAAYGAPFAPRALLLPLVERLMKKRPANRET